MSLNTSIFTRWKELYHTIMKKKENTMVGEVVLQTILAPQYIPALFDNMQNAEATERDIEI